MTRRHASLIALALLLLPALPAAGSARGLSVDVWTNRGNDAVYKPGEEIRIKVRPSEDAYVLVYEIDAEGYVHKLFPYDRTSGFLEGRATYELGEDRRDAELIAQGPVGQGYIVAIASLDPFEPMPWYLRSFDRQAEELGYEGAPEDEREGITAEGRVVGDPFVVMERIRRRVVSDPNDTRAFGTAYTSYYLHHGVRYPRYLCNDCHRPEQWSWWDGYDPYYTTCSVFDFRVNYHWGWGPRYWFGNVPYFVYVYRDDCPPYYRHPGRRSWSSWDGWGRWQTLWGGNLKRYKSPPPQGYVPPTKYDGEFRRPVSRALPPGFITSAPKDRLGRRIELPSGRQVRDYGRAGGERDPNDRLRRGDGRARDDAGDRDAGRGGALRRTERPVPSRDARSDDSRREARPEIAPRRDRDDSNGPPRVERRSDPPPPPPTPEPRREVERRNDPPPQQPPPPPRSPRPEPAREQGGIRGRR